MKKILFLTLTIAIFTFLGCATVYNPATGKNELVFIDTQQEIAIGKNAVQSIEREYRLSDDAALNNKVKVQGEMIAGVADRKDLDYIFKVVKNKEVNAFSLPGGFVYVNTGLLKYANDGELACVIAHEVGHIAARHGAKRLEAALGYTILANIALSQAKSADLIDFSNIIFNLITLGYSREDEFQADRLAVKYVLLAEFKPEGLISFFEKLDKIEGADVGPLFLRSHPYRKDRIKNIKLEIAKFKNVP